MRIARALGAVLLANELGYWAVRIHAIGFDGWLRNHLPLHLCGVAVLLTAASLLFQNRKTFEIAYFWGLAGAANAVLTPGQLDAGFPEYRFFQYFIAHSGIVAGVLFATWSLGMRPTGAAMLRAFALLNLFAVFVGAVNLLLGSNYLFLSHAPAGTVSPFFLLPWPWYLALLEVVGFGLFCLLLLPFWWRQRAARRARNSLVSAHSGQSSESARRRPIR